jgi:hypothetical protein
MWLDPLRPPPACEGHELDSESTALMPTNLPDPRKRKAQASEEPLLYVMVAVMVVGMIIALAIVGWSVAIAG